MDWYKVTLDDTIRHAAAISSVGIARNIKENNKLLNKLQQPKGNNCMKATHVKIMFPGTDNYLVVRAYQLEAAMNLLFSDVHTGLYKSYYSDPSEVKASDKVQTEKLPVIGYVQLEEMGETEHSISAINEKLEAVTKDRDYWCKRSNEKNDQLIKLSSEMESLRAERNRFKQARDFMLGSTEPREETCDEAMDRLGINS